jgi:hypothetical protein
MAFELGGNEGAAILSADSLAVCASMGLQIGGAPSIEQLPHRQPTSSGQFGSSGLFLEASSFCFGGQAASFQGCSFCGSLRFEVLVQVAHA